MALLAFDLNACGVSEGFLVPVPAADNTPGTSQVEMVVVTTRAPVESPAYMFGAGRAPTVSFADMVVSIPPDRNRKIGEVQWPQRPPGDPAKDFVTVKADIVTQDQANASLDRLLTKSRGREAFIFVHGFNNSYEDAVYRFAQILHDSGADPEVAPILFTWPSKGNVFAYGYDRDSSTYSRNALEALLRSLASKPQIATISILAHSMGNWVMLESLRQMAIRDGRVGAKIKLVLLADPDVDVDVSREQISSLGPKPPHLVLFVAENDRALAASRAFWEAPRLGAVDPNVEPYKEMLEREDVSVINMTHFPSHDFFNHGKFAEDPRIVELIGRSLAAGQTLTDARVNLGAKVMRTTAAIATSMGNVTGLALTAPLTLVDPGTRNGFGDQVNELTRSVGRLGSGPLE